MEERPCDAERAFRAHVAEGPIIECGLCAVEHLGNQLQSAAQANCLEAPSGARSLEGLGDERQGQRVVGVVVECSADEGDHLVRQLLEALRQLDGSRLLALPCCLFHGLRSRRCAELSREVESVDSGNHQTYILILNTVK